MAEPRQDFIENPRRVITDWLVNKQLSDQLGSSANMLRPVEGAADGFSFDPTSLVHQYRHPARPFVARSTQAARLEFPRPASGQGDAIPLVGGQFSSGAENWPAPSPATTRHVGKPNYWASGPFPPSDTGTRWGNRLANSFASAANTVLNPVTEFGASIAPYSDDLDAAAMTMRGIPDYGKLAAAPIAGASAWSKAAIRAARRLDRQGEQLAKQAGRNRVKLHAPSVRMDVDLVGRDHNGIPTPHTRLSPRNFEAPAHLPRKYNTSKNNADVKESTQYDLRLVRKYLGK